MAIKRSKKKPQSRAKGKQTNTFAELFFIRKKTKHLIKRRKWGILAAYYTFLFIAITTLWVISLRFVNPPITWLMAQRGIEQNNEGQGWKIQKKWMPYEELSDNLKKAAIAGEDAHFMYHAGFDMDAIRKAFQGNQAGKAMRGGSTISQQTAKNVFLWPQRSWLRKAFESYFTVLIELFWGKKRILEVYLNCIEMGSGIYGAEAATQHYYGKSARSLTKRQAGLMIAVLPNPRRWSPARPTAYINRKANTIAKYLSYSTIP